MLLGEHLRTCPQGPTCCTSTMEENLAGLSSQETEGLIREAGRSLQAVFNALYRSFDSEYRVCVCSDGCSLRAELNTRASAESPGECDACMFVFVNLCLV